MTQDRRETDLGIALPLDGDVGPARRLAPAQAAAIVDSALAAVLGAPVFDEAATEINHAPVPRPRTGRTLWLAAAALLVAGTAAAAVYITRAPAPQKLAPPPAAPDHGHAPVIAPDDSDPASSQAPPAPTPGELAMEISEADAAVPSPESPRKPRPAPNPATVEREAKEADDLLARANAARAKKSWKDADALYREVAAKYPGGAAAHVALTAAGSLHLEHLGDPAGARKLYLAALAVDARGPLAAEARWGLARVARAEKDVAAEKQALEDFLAHHPDAPQADQARDRLHELP